MFSEKTVELANKLKEVQEALSESIQKDLGLPDNQCKLCIPANEQIWFDDCEIPVSTIKAMLPIESAEKGIAAGDEHVYYKIGNVQFVTVLSIRGKQ